MDDRRVEILGKIEGPWRELHDALAAVPRERMEEAGAEGPWSVKDLIGHISTWEVEAMDSLGRYLPHQDLDKLAWTRDIDGFNALAVEGAKSTPQADLLEDLEKTHADLVRFIEGIEVDALGVPEVEGRVRVDTFEHYAEHTAGIRRWLAQDVGR